MEVRIQRIGGQWVTTEFNGEPDGALVSEGPTTEALEQAGRNDVVLFVESSGGNAVVGIDDAESGEWLLTLSGEQAERIHSEMRNPAEVAA